MIDGPRLITTSERQEAPRRIHIFSKKDLAKEAEKPTIDSETDKIVSVRFFKPTISFKDVVGLEKVKEYMDDHLLQVIKHRKVYEYYHKKQGLGILLFGPPGTGKTYFVSALAGEAKINMIVVKISEIISMYTGNTSKNIAKIFEEARNHKPCIIFFDELDALGGKRHAAGDKVGEGSAMRDMINEFLTQMDGIEKNPKGIFVIGSTNRPWDIDPALKRNGRFGDTTYFPAPNYGERKAMVEFYLKQIPHGKINSGRIARALAGYAPVDIATIIDESTLPKIKRRIKTKEKLPVTTGDVIATIKKHTKTSLDEWYLETRGEILGKFELGIINNKKVWNWKQGSLDSQGRSQYKDLIKDIKRNTLGNAVFFKKLERLVALYLY